MTVPLLRTEAVSKTYRMPDHIGRLVLDRLDFSLGDGEIVAILGTQWYILFNVIAGATALPTELRLAAQNLAVRRLLWWQRVMLPAIFPAYVTGAVTAAGGSWNASIVAEIVQWGDTTLTATGIGAYIARTTAEGDGARIALGIGVLCLYVLAFNRLLWRRLYNLAAERLRLD